MARRPRVLAPGLLYHVIARGNRRQPTFLTARDYQAYLALLATYRKRYGVALYAYCLMPNHVHLLAQTAEAPQQSYTQRFNRVHGKVGHLFQGRYRRSSVTGTSTWRPWSATSTSTRCALGLSKTRMGIRTAGTARISPVTGWSSSTPAPS